MKDNSIDQKVTSYGNIWTEFRSKQISTSGDKGTEKKIKFLSQEQNEIELLETKETNEICETKELIIIIIIIYFQFSITKHCRLSYTNITSHLVAS